MKKTIAIAAAIFSSTLMAQPEGGSDMFQALDADNNQAISSEEAQAYKPVLAKFKTFDSNQDGELSRAEFEQLLQG
ncbi:EF-hand domain-containing protein [Neptunomonas sp. XY-337]|uniref:EF-hand domain-containing protein n=1 Tax=Neptunomonas sp. XY-337 TaxID=2561897 RepID=UPI0010AA0340|nr:EF-hand domain-containing protein [Neptunomonas sp. XY-337]